MNTESALSGMAGGLNLGMFAGVTADSGTPADTSSSGGEAATTEALNLPPDNELQFFTATNFSTLAEAIHTANLRNCTTQCVVIDVVANIPIESSLLLNGSAVINGKCGQSCVLDGGGARQILAISGARTRVSLNSLKFTNALNNKDASIYGGATAVFSSAYAEFTDCQFEKNEAGQGGATAVYSGANVTWAGCSFLENTADSVGGAISIGGATGYVLFSSFAGNTAGAAAGGSGVGGKQGSGDWGGLKVQVAGVGV